MFGSVLIAIIFATFVHAQEGEIAVSDNKTQCINYMVQWCNNMQYPSQGAGMSMLAVTYHDPSGHYRVLCYSDSDGTNCTRNGNPWFTCSQDHTLTYKGNPITSASTDVDDDICNTTDKALNELFVQNLSYNSTSLTDEVHKSVQAFFNQMHAMAEQLEELQKRMREIPFLGHDFWGGFGGDSDEGFGDNSDQGFDWAFNRPYSTDTIPKDTRGSGTDDTNQIEKE